MDPILGKILENRLYFTEFWQNLSYTAAHPRMEFGGSVKLTKYTPYPAPHKRLIG